MEKKSPNRHGNHLLDWKVKVKAILSESIPGRNFANCLLRQELFTSYVPLHVQAAIYLIVKFFVSQQYRTMPYLFLRAVSAAYDYLTSEDKRATLEPLPYSYK